MKKGLLVLNIIIITILIFACNNVYAREVNGNPYGTTSNSTEVSSECTSMLGSVNTKGSPAYYINFAFKVIKYIAIVALIALSTMDIVKAITSQDQDVMNKTIKKIGTRAILCVVIFVLPTIIEFILQFVHEQQLNLCGIRGN